MGPGFALNEVENMAVEAEEYQSQRFKSMLQKGVAESRVAEIIRIASEGPIHMNDLALRLGSSRVFTRNACNFIVSTGRGDHILNVWVWPMGGHKPGADRRKIRYVDSLLAYRKKMSGGPGRRTGWCRECKLPGQLEHVVSHVCTSCQDMQLGNRKRHSTQHLEDDARWKRILSREHGERGCCLICGSPKAKERDGRYCSWPHDVIMLDATELDDLLDRYGLEQPKYDVWGRPR